MKKVSIIVGIYNSDKFLRKGLDSLVNQTWDNIEVLMIDDGSTDTSGNICDEYEKNDNRFIAIHKENSGVCDSRNKGLERATGEYVCFMDGDDWFAENFVEYMMSLIEQTNTAMVFSDKLFTTYDRTQNENDTVEIWNSEKAISNIIYPYMVLGPWNKLYSMKTIREHEIQFPPHWFGETLHFASTVAFYAGAVGVGHRKVYNYRLDNINSGTTQFNVSTRLLSLDNATKLRECLFAKNNKKIMNSVEWHIHTCYFNLVLNILACEAQEQYSAEYGEAKSYLRKHGLKVFLCSEVGWKEKILILTRSFAPEAYARWMTKRVGKRHRAI